MSKLIFLDTEYNSAGELAQLAYICQEAEKSTAKNFYFCVSDMDDGAQRVNGLTKSWLDEHGISVVSVKNEILKDFFGATLIAHNLNADKRVLEKAFGLLGNAFGLCTMYRFARVLKLPGGRPYKMPSLRELMAHYSISEQEVSAWTQQDFACEAAAHDARWDAEAVRLCAVRAIRAGDCRNLLDEERRGEEHEPTLDH